MYPIKNTKNITLETDLQHKINTKTKPLGALGQLEAIAYKIGCIQGTTSPEIHKPTILVFAGDHGIAKDGIVNPFPQEVTTQMVYNFLNGGAAINVFSAENAIDLKIIDAGVNHSFEPHNHLINCKIAHGTANYLHDLAMTKAQCEAALEKGGQIVELLHESGSNSVGFGEMGIGNTSSAALLMSYFIGVPIKDCVGSGTGLDAEGIQKKQEVLSEVFHRHQPKTPIEALAAFGGFEIVMICGAMLKAAELKMTLVIDGFIVTSALLAAYAMAPSILDYCIFAHDSDEQGHSNMLSFLGVTPLLNLGLRLGEGTGAALAFPLIRAAVAFLNHMASFESANVSTKI